MESRLADAIRRALRNQGRYTSYDVDDAGDVVEPADPTSWITIEDSALVEEALAVIVDPRKQYAFRLFMEGAPVESKGGFSISQELGISDRTARKWIGEVQSQLKQWMEAHDDRPRKTQP